MKVRFLQIPILITAGLLSIPLIAMQFTSEVNWSLFDFSIGGVLIFSVAMGIQWIGYKIKNRNHRVLVIIASLIVFLLVWAELAVGIFGSPIAGS